MISKSLPRRHSNVPADWYCVLFGGASCDVLRLSAYLEDTTVSITMQMFKFLSSRPFQTTLHNLLQFVDGISLLTGSQWPQAQAHAGGNSPVSVNMLSAAGS